MVNFKAKDHLDELDLIIKNKFEKLETDKILAIILIGKNQASKQYINIKTKVAEYYGIETETFEFKTSTKKKEIFNKIQQINESDNYGGLIVQYPFPSKYDYLEVANLIDPKKDVDFFNPITYGQFLKNNNPDFMPPVVRALNFIVDTYKLDIKGKNYCVVGQGVLVGKPISHYLIENEATVFSINEHSENSKDLLKQADVVVCGANSPKLIKGNMLKRGASVIDFSSGNKENPGVGDFDLLSEHSHLNVVSGVPGGVGPLTVRFLFLNFLEFVEKQYL